MSQSQEALLNRTELMRRSRLMRLKHANTVLVEISKVGSRTWANEAGDVCRLRITLDGRVHFCDHNPQTPTIDLHSTAKGANGFWPGFPYQGSEAFLLRGLRDYVANGTKIYRTLLVPLVEGRLARGYTPADLTQIEGRLKFVPIFVE
ncbi:hypothetical protein WG29040_23220 [Pseudomonas sp. PAMC 29040]|uniref:hypothetical protein n=1 Tax=Pseudomonas sp. PAMC 29040 TaxID=2498450 RepID=UPI000FBACBDE|nr:hypothetical protein [Pseudomonas sp. PAMC 29040]RUT30853.1 hypothetical protein WG29040_23220 [Pseudomonas sp. PAMC 29040]